MELFIDNIRPVTEEVLIVHQILLGLDFRLRVDVIAMLGGVHVGGSGEVSFAAENMPHRATITINEPGFSASAYGQQRGSGRVAERL